MSKREPEVGDIWEQEWVDSSGFNHRLRFEVLGPDSESPQYLSVNILSENKWREGGEHLALELEGWGEQYSYIGKADGKETTQPEESMLKGPKGDKAIKISLTNGLTIDIGQTDFEVAERLVQKVMGDKTWSLVGSSVDGSAFLLRHGAIYAISIAPFEASKGMRR